MYSSVVTEEVVGDQNAEFITVSLRIRPPDENLAGTLCLEKTGLKTASLKTKTKREAKDFSFDVVFDPEATQVGFHIFETPDTF